MEFQSVHMHESGPCVVSTKLGGHLGARLSWEQAFRWK